MARPDKEKELSRSRHVTLRLTETQHETITNAAKEAGLSRSDYIRWQLLNGKVDVTCDFRVGFPELQKLTSDYGKSLRYLMFQHDEFTQEPLRDDAGDMVLREEFYLDGLNCVPSTFDMECEELNEQWKKNQACSEIKSHHYIISFDPKDKTDHGLTGEKALRLGLEYAERNFPGHQALVCAYYFTPIHAETTIRCTSLVPS